MGRPQCWLMFLLTILSLGATLVTVVAKAQPLGAEGASAPSPPLRVEGGCPASPEDYGRDIFQGWQYANLTAAECQADVDDIETGAVCLYRIAYNHEQKVFYHNPVTPRHESSNSACATLYIIRLSPMLAGFALALNHTNNSINSDFTFYVDVSDSNNVFDLFSDLHIAVVSHTRHDSDKRAIVIPPTSFFLAALHNMAPAALDALNSTHLSNHAVHMVKIHDHHHHPKPWIEKQSKLVYRAGCFPTHYKFHDWIFPRLEVCQAAHSWLHVSTDAHVVDVGLKTDDFCDMWQGKLATMCAQCQALCPPRSNENSATMADNKYQLVVDGFGLSADSLVWKLASRSCAFWVTHNKDIVWLPWFYSVVKPHEHFIPVDAEGLQQQVQACIEDDARCQAIAERAYKTMRCQVTLEAGLWYTAMLLKHIHKRCKGNGS